MNSLLRRLWPGQPPGDCTALLLRLARASDDELASLVYGSLSRRVSLLPITIRLLRELQPPELPLNVVASTSQGGIRLLILDTPWRATDGPRSAFHPLLVVNVGGEPKIVGFVLPFNEIVNHFGKRDMRAIARLSVWWVMWLNEHAGPHPRASTAPN